MGPKETQGTFTGEDQRKGVYILPLVLPGLFRLSKRRRPTPAPNAPAKGAKGKGPAAKNAAAGGASAAKTSKRGFRGTRGTATGSGERGEPFVLGEGDEEDELPAGYSFDWAAYEAKFGDTPIHVAVTALFAEYAVLYGRIAGWTTTDAPPTMTLDEAADIDAHAKEFVLNYLAPILGVSNTSKVHKLLRHLLDAIQMHGNLKNCNTSKNESGHKRDKPYYNRTNKSVKGFTGQLVRQSQGSLELQRRLDKADAIAERMHQERAGERVGEAAVEAPQTSYSQPIYKLPRNTVGNLARRPGLRTLAAVLGLDAGLAMPVVGAVDITARLDCGALLQQTLRANPHFRGGEWFDAAMYTLEDVFKTRGGGSAKGGTASRGSAVKRGAIALAQQTPSSANHAATPPISVFVGEVHAIIRYDEEDVAVVVRMERVPTVSDCPLGERGCHRVRWAVPENDGQWVVDAVPLHRVWRVVNLAADFAELTKRRGVLATPPKRDAPLGDLRAMRYFVNALYPWK